MEKKNKTKIIFNIIKKKVKVRYLLLLIILLVSNSFAWFIYSKQIESDLTAHVRAWNVQLSEGDTPITSYVNINVDSIYPGMGDYQNDITVYNKGEIAADLTYEILDVNILGVETKTKEGVLNEGGTLTGTEKTSAELTTELANNYPFKTTITITSTSIDAEEGQSTYSIKVTWPYESGDDATDTTWGENAYTFKNNHPSSSSITMRIKLMATQKAGS